EYSVFWVRVVRERRVSCV
ncbi:unnamed protein product, partial [Medioppia subpectinata]